MYTINIQIIFCKTLDIITSLEILVTTCCNENKKYTLKTKTLKLGSHMGYCRQSQPSLYRTASCDFI